jgi:hypothetical protein
MTQQQKFLFDSKGWICLPNLLPPADVELIKRNVLRGYPYGPNQKADLLSGPAQDLLDHPVIVDVLEEVIGRESSRVDRERCYSFRCEGSFLRVKGPTTVSGSAEQPHGGCPAPFQYRVCNGNIFAGLVRVAWELTTITPPHRGTVFLSGSHKASLPFPMVDISLSSESFDGYSCPAGSAIVFTENLIHSGTPWLGDDPRVTIFNLYGPICAQISPRSVPSEVIQTMPSKRQTLFRGVWHKFVSRTIEIENDFVSNGNLAEPCSDLVRGRV